MTDAEFEGALDSHCRLYREQMRVARPQPGAQVVLTGVIGPYGQIALAHVQPARLYPQRSGGPSNHA